MFRRAGVAVEMSSGLRAGADTAQMRRTPGRTRRFGRDRSGASAVEFAIVAFPFIVLVLGLFEVALISFGSFVLDSATDQASRLIRTGQASNFNKEQFRQAVCDRLTSPIGCDASLKIDVQKFSNFSSIQLAEPLDKDGKVRSDFAFDPGGKSEVVVVRVFYEWPLIGKVPGGMGNMPNGNYMMISTSTFRNEPF